MRRPPRVRGPMGRLGCYLRASLRRRLFVWFGVSIFVTFLVVGSVMSVVGGLTGGPSWRQETERLRDFVSHRFAEVWDEPARREALARAVAEDLRVDVELRDASGAVQPEIAPWNRLGYGNNAIRQIVVEVREE